MSRITRAGAHCRTTALAGHGIMLQPNFLVRDDVRARRLVPLLPAYQAGELGIFAVYPQRMYLSAKVRSFVDFLSEALKHEVL